MLQDLYADLLSPVHGQHIHLIVHLFSDVQNTTTVEPSAAACGPVSPSFCQHNAEGYRMCWPDSICYVSYCIKPCYVFYIFYSLVLILLWMGRAE